jgi:type II secretory pathway pseudopilin PulG
MDTNSFHRRSEGGATLVEVLVAIVILSVGIVGIVGVLVNTSASGNRIAGRSQVSQVVTQVADAIQRTTWKCAPLAATSSYSADLLPIQNALLPVGSWAITVESVKWWGHNKSQAFGPSVGSQCPPAATPPTQALLLSVKIVAPGNRGSRTFDLVKRP